MSIYVKKVCSFVLAIALLLTTYTIVGISAETDVCALNEGQIGLLQKLRILASENPDLSAEVSRGELAKLICDVCHISPSKGAQQNAEFYDLTKDSVYYPYINECIGRGIFSGDGTGYFRPDDIATLEEACKVFSVALGYKVVGYLTSYVKTARTAGILDGVSESGKMTLGTATQMAYNMLHAGMYEAVTYGDEQTYKINEDYTALAHYHKMKNGDGILDGFYGTTLAMQDREIVENEIRINGARYYYDDGASLIGRHVIFYTKIHDEHQIPEIEYIYASEERNQELTIDAKNIVNKSGEIISYYDGNKERKVKFSDTGDMILNGISYPEYTDTDFKPASGLVTLIDNNADNIYDVAVIKELTFMIVGAVDLENNIVYDKNDSTNVLGSKTDKNVDLRLMRRNDQAHLSIIGEDSAVAVCKSRNTKGIVKINIYIPDESISGIVDYVGNDYIGVDGERYCVSGNTLYDEPVTLGDVVAVNIFEGNVGAVLHKEDGYMYGYLVDANEKGSGFSKTLIVKLMTSTRKQMVYDCVKKVRIDESVYTDSDLALSRLSTSAGLTYQQYSTHPYSQPIRYRVDANGKLTHLDTLNYDKNNESEDSLQLDKSWTVHKFFASSYGFYTDEVLEYTISPSTTAMAVPRKLRDKEEWYAGNFSNNANYVVEAYNVDEFTCAPKFLVAYAGLGESLSVSGGAVPFIVTDVQSVLNEDGEIMRKITVVGTSTTPVERIVNERVPDLQLQVGDVIRFNGGYNNEIVVMEKIVPVGEVPSPRLKNYGEITGPSFQASIRHAYGTVVANKDGVFVHTTSITDDDGGVENYADRHVYRINNNIPVWVYDSRGKKPTVTQGLWSDIISYEVNKSEPTRAFICTTSGALKYVYICK